MGEFLNQFKDKIKDLLPDQVNQLLSSKKNIINLLILGIMILGIPLTVGLLRQQQIIKSRAVAEPIVPTGPNVSQRSDGSWVAIRPQISLEITSPLGPPAGSPSPSPSLSPSPSPTSPAPANLTKSCGADGETAVFSWTAPVSGAAPSGYVLRVNQQKDVWAPSTDCDAKTSLCPGREGSGDFIPPNVTATNYIALIVPGATYDFSIQAVPNDSNPLKRRTGGGAFSCSETGTKNQITQPAAGGADSPTGLNVSCGQGGSVATAAFSWTAPVSGAAPSGYVLRVNQQKDVWAPSTDCDAKTSLCPGREGSGDFIPPNVTATNYIALIVPGATYDFSIQAAPNSGPLDRRTAGENFSCP